MRILLVFSALVWTLCCADEITGVVVDEDGNPAAGVSVQLDVGRARYALTGDFDRWYAVETKTVKAGADGSFAFTDLPAGAVGTAFVKTEKGIGIAHGTGQLRIKLGPEGASRARSSASGTTSRDCASGSGADSGSGTPKAPWTRRPECTRSRA